MPAVVHYCQSLFVRVCVVRDPSLESSKDLFDGSQAKISLLYDIHIFVEVVLLDVLAEDFHVLLDFGEVCEAIFFGVPAVIYSHEADGSVVNVAKDEALTFIWREVWHAGFLHFA